MCCIDDGFMDGYSYVSQEDIEQEEILHDMYMDDLCEEDMLSGSQDQEE